MKDLIRLTRPLNLLIIALTMALIRFGLVLGYLERGLHQFLRESGTGLERADLCSPRASAPRAPRILSRRTGFS